MSHFTVLVVTDQKDQHDAALQPFHEFECTGTNDQYVIDIDITQKQRDEYETDETWRLKDAQGNLHYPYGDEFYRDPTEEEKPKVGMGTGCGGGLTWTSKDWKDGLGYRPKVKFIPEGYEEITLLKKEIMTFKEFVEGNYSEEFFVEHGAEIDLEDDHKYGHAQLDENGEIVKIIDRTNPNAKWDWWVVGGRWRGLMIPKDLSQAEKGENGLMGSNFNPDGVDVCQVKNLDLAAMKEKQIQHMKDRYSKAFKKFHEQKRRDDENYVEISFEEFNDLIIKKGQASNNLRAAWKAIDEKGSYANFIDEKKNAGDPDAILFRDTPISDWEGIVEWKTLDQALEDVAPFSTFAVLMDGKWYEKGEMGWWAMVAGEDENWSSKFADLFASLDGEKWLTVVDCHI